VEPLCLRWAATAGRGQLVCSIPNFLYLFLPRRRDERLDDAAPRAGWAADVVFLRQFVAASPSCLGRCVIYMTSGFFTGHVIHTQMLNAAAWIPGPLLSGALAPPAASPRLPGAGRDVRLIILAGHPQIVYFTGLLSLTYLSFVLAGERRAGDGFSSRPGRLPAPGLLSSRQLWPTYALLQRSYASRFSYAFFADPSLPLDGSGRC